MNTRFCGQCGQPVPPGAQVCPYCGMAQGVVVPAPPSTQQKSKTGLILALVAVFAVFSAGLLLFLLETFGTIDLIPRYPAAGSADTAATDASAAETQTPAVPAATAAVTEAAPAEAAVTQAIPDINTYVPPASAVSEYSGTITTKTYTNGSVQDTYNVLTLTEPIVAPVYPPFSNWLGNTYNASQIRVLGFVDAGLIGVPVSLTGALVFDCSPNAPVVVVLKNVTSITAVSAAPSGQKIPFTRATASSDQGVGSDPGRTFYPSNAIDGNYSTCWMVNSTGAGSAGAGNWIRFEFSGEQTVRGVRLLNGNGWDGRANGYNDTDDLYGKNGRIKNFTLTFSDGSKQTFTAADAKEYDFGSNVFYFNTPVRTSSITLTINSGYPGWKYSTVACLSEFEAFS
ncbi:MAG: discoidin domain-containing protein [Clostridia bacterium]|nr:discoidin domain-containing protein [Clostridia bacterium]